MTMLAGLSPAGTLMVRAGEPKVLNVAFAQADGTTPQNLQGRTFALVIRRTDRLEPLFTFPAELSADALYASIMMTAELASAVYDAGRELALTYDIVELSGGASQSRFSQRVKVVSGPTLPSDIVPIWAMMPYTEALIRPDALVISEKGAKGDGAPALEAAAAANAALLEVQSQVASAIAEFSETQGAARNRKLHDRLRRAANKAALSNPRIVGLYSAPPAITDNGPTSPPVTAANYFSCNGASRGVWHCVGGRYGIAGRISAGVLDATLAELNTYARFEAMADSRYLTVRVGPTTAPYRFIVDDRYVSLSGTVTGVTTGSTDQYLTLDFGNRAVRRIVVEATRTGKFFGGYVEDGAKLWPVDVSDIPHAVFLGDSYVYGSGPDVTADGVAVQMADRMGIAVQASGSGGTGWNQTNASVYNFRQRIMNGDLALAYYPPEVIFILSSINDAQASQTYATVQANALAGLQAARAQFPDVPIVVFGCIAAPSKQAAEIANVEAAVAAAVTAFADALCRFVPIDSDPLGKWITGVGSELRFTAPLVGAVNATLSTPWPGGSSATSYTVLFSDGSTRVATFTQNATAVNWSGAVTASATAMVRQVEGNARFTMHPDWSHPSAYGAAYIGERYARGALAALESMFA